MRAFLVAFTFLFCFIAAGSLLLQSQPSFGPASLGGLVLYLDGNDTSTMTPAPTNGSSLSGWNDKSRQGNNWTQATGARQPTWVANAVNGRGAVSFNNQTMISSGQQFINTGTGFSFIFVQKFIAFKTGNNFFTTKTNVAGIPAFDYRNSKSRFELVNGASFGYFQFAQSTDTSAYHIVQYDYNGSGAGILNFANFNLYYDRGSAVAGAVNDLGAGDGNTTVIGSYNDVQDANYNGFNILALLLVYNKQLSSTERGQLNNWLNKNYGI